PVLEEQFSLALASHRPVRMVYMSPRLSDELRIDVYLLFKVFYERAWYVITRDVGSRSYYPCRLDRIKELKLLDGYPIHQTLGEDIEEAHYLMGCGWGMTFPATRKDADRGKTCPETVVRFSAKVAPYIVEVSGRHPMAKVGYARDGSGDAVFRIRLLDLWEFKHWVRQFGSNAWFLSPPSVVDEEKAEVRRMAARYGWSSDP
ncbi:MAG TPA: WYL domain-containing protein, partial [Candidatus Obscuribacterales bacterium]